MNIFDTSDYVIYTKDTPPKRDYIFSKNHLNNEDGKSSYANMDRKEKQQYLKKFKEKTGVDFSSDKDGLEYYANLENTKNKLYKGEYSHSGEIEYLDEYCSKSQPYIDTKQFQKDDHTFRFVSYNVHSFIKSCAVYVKKNVMTDIIQLNNPTDSTQEIINFLHRLNPDAICLQEFSPTIFDKDGFLRLRNFIDTFNAQSGDNLIADYAISDCSKALKISFFGNAVFLANDRTWSRKFVMPFHMTTDTRCFIGGTTMFDDQKVTICNIHPASETVSNENHDQIMKFFQRLQKTDPYSKNIVVMGDFNTSDPAIHREIEKMGFFNVNKLINIVDDTIFSGYHGTLIDHVYVSNYFLSNFYPYRLKILQSDLSDHYPIMFDFRRQTGFSLSTYQDTLNRYYDSSIKHFMTLPKETILERLQNYSYRFDHIVKKALQYGEIINLDENTYLFHGTSFVSSTGDIPFEITEDISTPSTTKSCTFLHYAGESFSNYYGTNDPTQLKRGIIYKIKNGYKLPVINLFKKLRFQERIDNRLDFYIELYEEIRTELIQKGIFKEYELVNCRSKKCSKNDAFDVMRALWVLLEPILLNTTDPTSVSYNSSLFYGTINTDFIVSDSAYLKGHIDSVKQTYIWADVEVYEGLEVMVYHPTKFLEFHGVFYGGKMYTKQEWIDQAPSIVVKLKQYEQDVLKEQNLLQIPNIRKGSKFPRVYAEKYLIKYLKIYLQYIIALYSDPLYTSPDVLNSIDQKMKSIFHRNHPAQSYMTAFTLKLLLRDFNEQIHNLKYSKFYTVDGIPSSDVLITKINNFVNKKIPDGTSNPYLKYIKKTIVENANLVTGNETSDEISTITFEQL